MRRTGSCARWSRSFERIEKPSPLHHSTTPS